MAHLAWADQQALAALRNAAPPPAGALELYAHVLGAEQVWLARLRQKPPDTAVWPELELPACAELARANHENLERYLHALRPADLEREIPYTNSAGRAFRSRVDDILTHLALHGCYHRGQVALELRRAGVEPLPTDYIAFIRGAAAATRVR